VTDTANPFLVARVDSTTIWSGFWIAEDIADLASAYERGDWIDGLIGGFGATMDALAYVFDPVGSLVASGIAWAIEQIKPVSDVLDWLAGDPDQIVAYAPAMASRMKHQLGEAIESLGHGSKTPAAPSADHARTPSDPRSPSDDHLRKSVNFTLIDLTGFSDEAKASIRTYVDSLPTMDQDHIIRVGF
jgi:hypothetical protein